MIDKKLAQDICYEMSSMASQIGSVIDFLASHEVGESGINKNQLKVNVGRLANVREELDSYYRVMKDQL